MNEIFEPTWEEALLTRHTLAEEHRPRMLAFIRALESGDYLQGKGRMEAIEGTRVTNCCLGVLCRLAMADGVQVSTERVELARPVGADRSKTTFGGLSGHPPVQVLAWLLPGVHLHDMQAMLGQRWLVHMNDTRNRSFVEIAQFLRDRFDLPKEADGV